MNQYVTGAVIKELREKNKLTQSELAAKLNVSDKTVSKWETAKGYPDISLLEPIASVFGISITELLSGNAITNMNVSANMLRSKFYVCPICGNVIHSIGEVTISCHGVQLLPEQAELSDERHMIRTNTKMERTNTGWLYEWKGARFKNEHKDTYNMCVISSNYVYLWSIVRSNRSGPRVINQSDYLL